MLIAPRQSPDCCKQVIAWRVSSPGNESSDRLLVNDGDSISQPLLEIRAYGLPGTSTRAKLDHMLSPASLIAFTRYTCRVPAVKLLSV